MKANVNQEKCIGCGNCVGVTENKVFDFNDSGRAECILEEIPEELVEATNTAIEQCPTEAIEEVK